MGRVHGQAEQVMVAASGGGGLAPGGQGPRQQADVRELARCYMERHAKVHKKPSSIAMDQRLLQKVVLPGLGGIPVAMVSPADIVRLHQEQREYPVKANRVLALLSKMFNLAEDWGFRPQGSNPVIGVQRHPERGREWASTAEDYVRLWRALDESAARGKALPTLPLAVKLLMLLGCYKKEILSLRWSQVRLDEGYILFTDSKGRSRLVALPQAALRVLRDAPRREDNPFVCWGRKGGSHVMGVNRYFKGLVEQAGLAGRLRIQDLRHIPPASSHWQGMI